MNTLLRSRLVAGIAVGALALAACGGDDDDGGGDSPQDQVADMLLQELDGSEADMEGVTIDEDCIRDITGDLSDEDAQAIVDAGPDGDPEVSVSGEELGLAMLDCIDIDLSEIEG